MPSEATAPTDPRPTIRKLPPLLVNQIAAGEVIERPASVVKELVENALDAGATRIAVELDEGGIDRIRVVDDGVGMTPDQLPLALAPHATSKVREAEDLDRIATMGFRGEALASIASVSRMTITSRPRTTDSERGEGALIAAEGADISPVRPAACPPGTAIEVRTLFFNTPARRKFVRTETTERTRCLDWLKDLALAHPAVGFRCESDGKVRLDLPPRQTPRERVLGVLGEELRDQLVEVSVDRFDDDRGVLIWGLIGLPSIARATAKFQHVFLNGRTIRDGTVQHAIREGYRGLIEPGRYPTAVLMLEMSPAAVDVNVHPAKLEVRFRDRSMVHRAVLMGVREALARVDLTPSAADRLEGFHKQNAGLQGLGRARYDAGSTPPAGGHPSPEASAPPGEHAQHAEPKPTGPGLGAQPPGRVEANAFASELRGWAPPGRNVEPEQAAFDASAESALVRARKVERVLQVHDSYLVVEDEKGILLIDQHALHERVMFETLLGRIGASGRLESQRLLTPAVLEVDPEQLERLDELSETLERVGLELTPMGPRSVGVMSVPTLLIERRADPVELAQALLRSLSGLRAAPDSEEALHEVLDTMACKAAIKAGDPLTEGEIEALIRQRHLTARSGSCPHGRTTTVRLSLTDLEKLFDRR